MVRPIGCPFNVSRAQVGSVRTESLPNPSATTTVVCGRERGRGGGRLARAFFLGGGGEGGGGSSTTIGGSSTTIGGGGRGSGSLMITGSGCSRNSDATPASASD